MDHITYNELPIAVKKALKTMSKNIDGSTYRTHTFGRRINDEIRDSELAYLFNHHCIMRGSEWVIFTQLGMKLIEDSRKENGS